MPSFTVSQLAALSHGVAEGNQQLTIDSAASLEEAGPTQIAFAGRRASSDRAQQSAAGCLLVSTDFAALPGRTMIRVGDPRAAFASLLAELYPEPVSPAGVHPTAIIALSAQLGKSSHIGPNVVIGEGVRIGDRCRIKAGCVIEADVVLGDDCVLHPNVTVYRRSRIGNRFIAHSGTVIGADGFGFAFQAGSYVKFPQIGWVEIEDDVEVGANACIDRGSLSATRIGKGTKLDNMVHVGHNCLIGNHVVIAAQTGLSGGAVIGDYAVLGGQVGLGDKVRVEARAIVASKAGVPSSKIIRAGSPVWGIPARPLKQYLENLAMMSKLPGIVEDIKQLKQRLAAEEKPWSD